eukprot:TRINITY_DN18564_c0_g1_i1.p1 TRINITY_DN18564_c0_g1~~TRINITY_DN18564_c0_g1_i1.p1  ORF type:complete len:554 (+),score=102.15 TRINITY_DN18564_c0_g1_i1:79-1662(+)
MTKKVFPGDGSIVVSREGVADLTLPVATSPWVQVSGTRLIITPREPWGGSLTCSRITIGKRALIDSDGAVYNAVGHYQTCVADRTAPVIISIDPPSGIANQALQPKFKFAFNEAVRVTAAAPMALLTAKEVPQGTSFPASRLIDLNSASVRISIWNSINGAIALDVIVDKDLMAGTRYELELRPGSVEDLGGNVWNTGQKVIFTTICPSGATCVSPATAPSPPGSSPSKVVIAANNDDASPPIALYLGIVTGIVFVGLGMLGLFQLYVKWRMRQIRLKSSKIHPTPAAPSYVYVQPPSPAREGQGLRNSAQANAGHNYAQSQPSASAPSNEPPGYGSSSKPTEYRKAREAEDVRTGHGRHSVPPNFQQGPKPRAHTDDSAAGGGWIKYIDPSTGKPFWTHYKTQEKRWDPPPSASASATAPPPRAKAQAQGQSSATGAGQSGTKSQPTSPQPQKPPEKKEPETPASRTIKEVDAQMVKTKGEDIASRKKTFKFLCLKWHPDKNQDQLELATEVFQFIQNQRDWYLKE